MAYNSDHQYEPDQQKAKRSAQHHLTAQQKHERKQRVLTKGAPSIALSIAEAVVIKDGNLFFLARQDGTVPLSQGHGFGLYYHDCRYLNGYELTLNRVHPEPLVATAEWGYRAVFQLTNPDIHVSESTTIHKDMLDVKWERVVDAPKPALYDRIAFQNFAHEPVEFVVSLTFRCEFEDVFAIRGMFPEKFGTLHSPRWDDDDLLFRYDGADGLSRSLTIHCLPRPEQEGTTAHVRFALQPKECRELLVSLIITESNDHSTIKRGRDHHVDFDRVERQLTGHTRDWMNEKTTIRSDSLVLTWVIQRSLLDLRMLTTSLNDQQYLAAGVPWFVALFGRDSLIASLQTLAYDPDLAEQTLRLLATYQGTKVDHWRDEEPGKMLHELRVGEMAHLHEIPQTPYYGTVDATPLFLIVLGSHAQWTGRLDLFRELKPHVERALAWLDKYGDHHGTRYLAYRSSSEKGLVNQGWKDSGDAIVNADGSLARPPIALAEVQGYVYLAKMIIADLFRRTGEEERAQRLLDEAALLRKRFNHDFWMENQRFYALALQADQAPCRVITSNPGQALWSGIVDDEKAQFVVDRLLREDMFNGWGIRTSSSYERRYNPIGYHLGTVWPHDNSLIAAGFRRYGYATEACRILTSVLEAALHFRNCRLPEVFAGFSREEYAVPVHYPVACHPQAWAAGAVPYLLETCLGLHPEAFDARLRITRPILPDFVNHLEISRLRVGGAMIDLRFKRQADGTVQAEVVKTDGNIDIVHEPP
jgi:glycogen debranching enzyme